MKSVVDKANTSAMTLPRPEVRAAIEKAVPLRPNEIETLKARVEAAQRAARKTPPKQVESLSLRVPMTPGARAPVVHLCLGYVSVITFVDATGQPWPITSVTVGDPKAFNAPAPVSVKHNVLTVTPLSAFGDSNLAVTLDGATAPVVLWLTTNTMRVDANVFARVDGMGPFGSFATASGAPPGPASPDLLSALDGVPPPGSVQLTIHGAGGTAVAWKKNQRIYLRTTLALLSPAWIAQIVGAGGMQAYELPVAPIVVAADPHGRIITLTVEDAHGVDAD